MEHIQNVTSGCIKFLPRTDQSSYVRIFAGNGSVYKTLVNSVTHFLRTLLFRLSFQSICFFYPFSFFTFICFPSFSSPLVPFFPVLFSLLLSFPYLICYFFFFFFITFLFAFVLHFFLPPPLFFFLTPRFFLVPVYLLLTSSFF